MTLIQIIPRIYQKQAVPKIKKALSEKGRALVVMATGLGKTITSALCVDEEIERGRGVFLAHSNEILKHARNEFKRVYNNQIALGTFHGYKKDFSPMNVLFASFQTMKKWKSHFPKNVFRWMIVDESHHGQAPTFKKVITYFNVEKLLGITATPNRKDKHDIRDIFGKEVVDYTLEEAIAKRWLPPIEYHVVTDTLDDAVLKSLTRQVLQEGERISLSELNHRVFIRARDQKVAEIIHSHSKKAIIFCRNIRHIKHFLSFLDDAAVYHSKQSREKNQEALKKLRNGEIKRLLVVNAFNEGVDVPDVEVVVFYRATESETIFRQQLGRGLRLGKEKLIVLDFVANIERIVAVKQLSNEVKKIQEEELGTKAVHEGEGGNLVHIEGKGFDFTFSDKAVDLLKIFERIKAEFYPTWQDASKATRLLSISSAQKYWEEYKKDPRLPRKPYCVYPDFPGWKIFLKGNNYKPWGFYQTCKQASISARRLRISSPREYHKRYKEDTQLPSSPDQKYHDFPGWPEFLRGESRNYYLTWQRASKGAKRLGIQTWGEYRFRYNKDPRLPPCPNRRYKDFPGFSIFLGNRNLENYYRTCQQAITAVRKLGVKSSTEYKSKYKKDPKLSSAPDQKYHDFPGWIKFLGKKEKPKFYSTWQKASRAVTDLKFKSVSQYRIGYRKDPKLYSSPDISYKNFPGWKIFLGKE